VSAHADGVPIIVSQFGKFIVISSSRRKRFASFNFFVLHPNYWRSTISCGALAILLLIGGQ
jgi:hypothetical protein